MSSMYRYWIMAAAIVSMAPLQGQNTFFRAFGSPNTDFGTNLVRTTGNGFAITLSTTTNPPLNSQVNPGLIKLNEIGHLQWKQEYRIDSSSYTADLLQTADQGFLMGGWMHNGGIQLNNNRMMLARFNSVGLPLWGYRYSLTASDRVVDVFPSASGGFVMVAIANDNVWIEDALIIKTDANGTVLWTRRLADAQSLPGEIMALSGAEMSNGDIVICATIGANSFTDILLVKLRPTGELIWARRYGTTYDDVPTSMKINALDEIYVTGYSYFVNSAADLFVMKTDTQGILKNHFFLDAGTAQGEQVRDFDFAGGRLILAGDIGGFDERDAFLALVNVNGSVEWSKRYPSAPLFTNYPYEVVALPGDGYAFTGDLWFSFASREAPIVKTDNEGNAGCYTQPFSFTSIVHSFDTSSVSLISTAPQVTRTNAMPVVIESNFTEKQLCEFIYPVADFDTSGFSEECPLNCFDFHDTSHYGPIFQWQWSFEGGQPPTSTEQHPQHICFGSSGLHTITLVVTNAYASDTLHWELPVNLQCPITVPNVFTPDGDGINDLFQVNGLPEIFTLSIYNRWGLKVFETEDGSVMWNGQYLNSGQSMPGGVYYYVLSAQSLPQPQSGFLHMFVQ